MIARHPYQHKDVKTRKKSLYKQQSIIPVDPTKLIRLQSLMISSKMPTILSDQFSAIISQTGLNMKTNPKFQPKEDENRNNCYILNPQEILLKSTNATSKMYVADKQGLLKFQKAILNYITNSGLNRFSRDFESQLKSLQNHLRHAKLTEIAREVNDLNMSDKNFTSNFQKIYGHFMKTDLMRGFNPANTNNNNNNLNVKCLNIFENISKQIQSNELIISILNSILNPKNNENSNIIINSINNTNQETIQKGEIYYFSFNQNENNHEYSQNDRKTNHNDSNIFDESFSSPSVDETAKNRKIIGIELNVLREHRTALKTTIELKETIDHLRTEIDNLSKIYEKCELLKSRISNEEDFVENETRELSDVQIISNSIFSILDNQMKFVLNDEKDENETNKLEKQYSNDHLNTLDIATVDFSNMNLEKEIKSIENKLKEIEKTQMYLNNRQIENVYFHKKAIKQLQKEYNYISTLPPPPILQKYKNTRIQQLISEYEKENEEISIDRSEFDDYEILSNSARKYRFEYNDIKEALEKINQEIAKNNNQNSDNFNHQNSSFHNQNYENNEFDAYSDSNISNSNELNNDYSENNDFNNYSNTKNPTNTKIKKFDKYENERKEAIRKMEEIQDEYGEIVNEMERYIYSTNQEKLHKKRHSIMRNRRNLNELLSLAYERCAELKENLDIEHEFIDEAQQRGIEMDQILTELFFECHQKQEMIDTINFKCEEICENFGFIGKDLQIERDLLDVSLLEKFVSKIFAEKGKKKCEQIIRILNLRNEIESLKKK